jgi:hypothetical protein
VPAVRPGDQVSWFPATSAAENPDKPEQLPTHLMETVLNQGQSPGQSSGAALPL